MRHKHSPTRDRRRVDWTPESKCLEYPRLFTGDESKGRMDIARPICKSCPVFDECLNYAIVNDMYGIWAGTTTNQRKDLPERVKQRAFRRTSPEPTFQSYLKKPEVELPKKPPKIVTKRPVAPDFLESGNLPQTNTTYLAGKNTSPLVRMVESPEEQVQILDQLLLGLQSLSSPAKPLAESA
ncbi:transcriptional regulator WhiB-like [Arthrobacter phage Jasmine]|uniref:WhiB family transcription factor n=1 Tax=Arthrobacter phage Jasmine TaxID=1772302 RepID=A0A0U4JYS2_9CAUD|nr:transcriptional regulator WhiB-like [Arthrobacter phage Jasmine]ALY09330.1 WhiB family transcription factor [Arthrobacter phage Jasmine]